MTLGLSPDLDKDGYSAFGPRDRSYAVRADSRADYFAKIAFGAADHATPSGRTSDIYDPSAKGARMRAMIASLLLCCSSGALAADTVFECHHKNFPNLPGENSVTLVRNSPKAYTLTLSSYDKPKTYKVNCTFHPERPGVFYCAEGCGAASTATGPTSSPSTPTAKPSRSTATPSTG